MDPQWNTPPNGDFASYVERLSAQSALPRRAPQEGDPGLDVGMTPSSGMHGAGAAASAAADAARRSSQSNGEVLRSAHGRLTWPGLGAVARSILAWADEQARKQQQQQRRNK